MKFLSHFSRVTSKGRVFLPHVDGLRFIAIITVIAYHIVGFWAFHTNTPTKTPAFTGNPLIRVFEAGHLGVSLFFAISGFILALPFAEHALRQGRPVRLRAYFFRRLTRLEPPYVINLILVAILTCFIFRFSPAHPEFYHNPEWLKNLSLQTLASLFYSHNLIFGQHPVPNVVVWSLEVEVQFYILMPLFAQFFRIRPTALRRALLLAVIAGDAVFLYNYHYYRVWASLAGNLSFFFVGLLVADLHLLDWEYKTRRYLAADFLFVLAGAGIVMSESWRCQDLVLPWLLLVLVGCSFRGLVARASLSLPWVATIGGMCYTIYLYHFIMLTFLIRVTGAVHLHTLWLDLFVQTLILIPLIVVISAFLFVFLERPFMISDWPARFWKWATGRPSAQPE